MDRYRVNVLVKPRRIIWVDYLGGGVLEVTLASGESGEMDETMFLLLTGIDWEQAAADRAMEDDS